MKRRELLLALASSPLAGCGLLGSHPPQVNFNLSVPPTLTIDTTKSIGTIARNALGLSFETSRLQDPSFLSADNAALVGLIRSLGPRGVLRLGGRSADTAQWAADAAPTGSPSKDAPALDIRMLKRLDGLLDACDWSLIYGLDFAHGNPQRAAAEAAAVQQYLGDHLLAVHLGAAPDRYVAQGWRPSGYDAAAYANDWRQFARAVRDAAPALPLAGPGAAGLDAAAWTRSFVDQCGDLLRLVTAEEDGDLPARRGKHHVTRDKLLQVAAQRDTAMNDILASARSHHLPAWITQCGLASDGHTEDTLEAALWAIWTFYRRGQNGWSGLCFHEALHPAASADKTKNAAPPATALAGPLYYGLRLLAQTLPAQLLATRITMPPRGSVQTPPPATLQAWALYDGHQRLQLVLLNAERNQSVDLRFKADRELRGGTILTLAGPGFEATSDVTLAAASVDAYGTWQPQFTETVQWASGYGWLTLPAASAVLVLFD
ncbi:MAG TPA: glycosyl hydrolase family 79 C-terminal domain-containing protein [Nevskiaceae bacterium]|nr:glycosyl hydrolase family 79 C-terminal domain-containing protein [Nevskiaceae bacterium]